MITKFTIFFLINNFNSIGYALGVSAISGYDIRRVHATQTACTCYVIGVHHDTLSCLLSSCPTVLLLLRVSCSTQLRRSPGAHEFRKVFKFDEQLHNQHQHLIEKNQSSLVQFGILEKAVIIATRACSSDH